jgi:tetratricopeptide (TPR) repeat protein
MPIERMMIVDEDEANLLFFQVLMGELGLTQVYAVNNANQAIEEVKERDVQMIVVAWEMKTMPGTVLIQKLRSMRARRGIPYLIYSKRMSESDVKLAGELGLSNMLSMPFDRAKAKAVLSEMMAKEAKLPPEETKLRKAEGFLDEGRAEDALKLIDDRLKKPGPFFLRGQLVVVQAWMQLNQWSKAEPILRKILDEDKNHFEAQNLLAQILSRTGRHADALAILEALSKNSAKNMSLLLNLGSAYVSADRNDDAKKAFAQVEAMDKDNRDLKDERGKLAFKEGDLSLAAQLLRETDNGDQMARHFNNVAVGLVQAQQFDKAIETYEYAIKLLQARAKVHLLRYNLGLALSKKGDFARSFLELVTSYKSEPTFEKAYAALARVGKAMQEKGIAYDKQLVKEVNAVRKAQKATEAAAQAKGPADPTAARDAS